MTEKKTMGLWRKNGITGGKYLVQRRDGTIPDWPFFVIGARDPYAPAALRAYANAAEDADDDPYYVSDLRALATEFEEYRKANGSGDPSAVPHRKDDPSLAEKFAKSKCA